ncbi:MAG: hypothetical protein IJZ39_08890 [Oscillospiraceae bacterium]|nr:hypothetical protein [Oscillospiraceae bacterium]
MLNPDTRKYEEMDPEERKYEAKRRITRMVAIRIAMSLLLLWVILRFKLPVAMIALLIGVIILILGTLAPVIGALQTSLRYEDEDDEE